MFLSRSSAEACISQNETLYHISQSQHKNEYLETDTAPARSSLHFVFGLKIQALKVNFSLLNEYHNNDQSQQYLQLASTVFTMSI